MEFFLVMANTPMDNVPLSAWATEAEAVAAAKATTFRAVEIAAGHVLGVDVSECVCVAVVPFRFGLPGPMRIVKEDVE